MLLIGEPSISMGHLYHIISFHRVMAIFSILWHNAQEAPEGRQIQGLHILAINQHLAEG